MRDLFITIVSEVTDGRLGGTYGPDGNVRTYLKGYSVGIADHEFRFKRLDPVTLYDLTMWLDGVRDGYFGARPYSGDTNFSVGLWFDTDTKEYCLDMSLYIPNLDRAVGFGRDNRQKCIWGWAERECIPC